MNSIVFVVAASESASVLRESLRSPVPPVLHKDERLSVRLAVSHDSQVWDIIIVGKALSHLYETLMLVDVVHTCTCVGQLFIL